MSTGKADTPDEIRPPASSDPKPGRQWSSLERERMFPNYWPYRDLPLRCRNCPLCGWDPHIMMSPVVHPMAFCDNDDCKALSWDPSMTAAQVLRDFMYGEDQVP